MQPHRVLAKWLAEAVAQKIPKADAMFLATVGQDGMPSSRMVLVNRILPTGITFCTDVRSRKAQEIALNAKASVVFYWPRLGRQVRIEGIVELADVAFAEADFRAKSRQQQLLIRICEQSSIADRSHSLAEELATATAAMAEAAEIPRPDHWRAYLLKPVRLEFFVGGKDRLNKRLLLTRRADGRWEKVGLLP